MKGQASHVLRHTFASHFMVNGGNIRVLQSILEHSDIKMTVKYEKLIGHESKLVVLSVDKLTDDFVMDLFGF